jgi:hypothetical protein
MNIFIQFIIVSDLIYFNSSQELLTEEDHFIAIWFTRWHVLHFEPQMTQ